MSTRATATVLFDLDGTLLDPAGAITEGLSDAIAAHGFERPTPEILRKFVGPSTDQSLNRYTDIPEKYHREILATYRGGYLERARASSKLYPGMLELLQDLSQLPAAIGLATQKPLPTTEKLLDDFDIAQYFDVVSGSRDELQPATMHLPADKAGVIDRALRLLDQRVGQNPEYGGADPERAVMIGDREYDVAGATTHGIPCIGVSWGFASEDELAGAGAVTVVDDAAQLRAAIAQETGLESLANA
ncbi:HAD hydrolase-like protein [Rothia uropygioeca]|uniref:HAD hydrolase-like protein n=1 Tax=Kocuria sp. 257 TaxID=2021970 RepID=UPI0010118BC5|nr:HAD hydrolase-like protein [Kocuria sp. 257]